MLYQPHGLSPSSGPNKWTRALIYDDTGELVYEAKMKAVWGILCYAIGGGEA